jgi:hypothetical protein
MRRKIFGRLVNFHTASKEEPYWHFHDDQGFWHRSLFCIEIVRREQDKAQCLVITIARWHFGITL